VYLKNIGDCMRSHNGSIDTTQTPPPLSFYNTFNVEVIAYSFCWRERKQKYDFYLKAACSNYK
jgi:hypothetical protein